MTTFYPRPRVVWPSADAPPPSAAPAPPLPVAAVAAASPDAQWSCANCRKPLPHGEPKHRLADGAILCAVCFHLKRLNEPAASPVASIAAPAHEPAVMSMAFVPDAPAESMVTGTGGPAHESMVTPIENTTPQENRMPRQTARIGDPAAALTILVERERQRLTKAKLMLIRYEDEVSELSADLEKHEKALAILTDSQPTLALKDGAA